MDQVEYFIEVSGPQINTSTIEVVSTPSDVSEIIVTELYESLPNIALENFVYNRANFWNSVYSTVSSTSSLWNSVYSYVNTTSSFELNQENVTSFVLSNSANIISVNSVVNNLSSNTSITYFENRPDGLYGSGTSIDPYNGIYLDDVLLGYRILGKTNVSVVLGKGTFYTKGKTWLLSDSETWNMLDGWSIRGMGIDVTTLKLSRYNFINPYPNDKYAKSVSVIDCEAHRRSNIRVSDLTVDGSYSDFCNTTTQTFTIPTNSGTAILNFSNVSALTGLTGKYVSIHQPDYSFVGIFDLLSVNIGSKTATIKNDGKNIYSVGYTVSANSYVGPTMNIAGVAIQAKDNNVIERVRVTNCSSCIYEGGGGLSMTVIGDRVIGKFNRISNCIVDNIWGNYGWLVIFNSNNQDSTAVGGAGKNGAYIEGIIENCVVRSSLRRHQCYASYGARNLVIKNNYAYNGSHGYFNDVLWNNNVCLESNLFDSCSYGILFGGGYPEQWKNLKIYSNIIRVGNGQQGIFYLGNAQDVYIKNNIIQSVDPTYLGYSGGINIGTTNVSGVYIEDNYISPNLTNSPIYLIQNLKDIYSIVSPSSSHWDTAYNNISSVNNSLTLINNSLSTYSTSQLLNCGLVTLPNIWITSSGILSADSCYVNINSSADFSDIYKKYLVSPLLNYQLSANVYSYLTIDYHNGMPSYNVIQDNNLVNHSNVIQVANLLWENLNSVNESHIFKVGTYGLGLSNKIAHRLIHTERFGHESGLSIGESSNRTVLIGDGKIWYDGTDISLNSVDSVNNPIHLYYHTAPNVWGVSLRTQYSNSEYDDNTGGLKTASGYVVNWIYRGVSNNSIFCVLGTQNYNKNTVQAAQPPATLPSLIAKQSILVGRIIVANGASTAYQIDSAFDLVFNPSTDIVHNDLLGRDASDSHPASAITNTPFGGLSSTNVQDALNELDSEKANLTLLNTLSAQDVSVFSTVQSNSATNWNYQGTDLKALSANWQSTYTSLSTYAPLTTLASVSSTLNSNFSNYALLSLGTLTANTPQTYTQTWSNSAVTFTGWKYNVTDTASNASSLLADFQVNGVSKFSVTKGSVIRAIDFLGGASTFSGMGDAIGGISTGRALCVGTYGNAVDIASTQALITNTDNNSRRLLVLREKSGTTANQFELQSSSLLPIFTLGSTGSVSLYNTYTDASNYERGFFRWNSNVLEIGTEAAGTGTARNISLYGNVGVGTTTPEAPLSVSANGGASKRELQFWQTPNSPNYGMRLYGDASDGVFKLYGLSNGVENTNPIVSFDQGGGKILIGGNAIINAAPATYSEGIRVNVASNNYAGFHFGGAVGSTSGTNVGEWTMNRTSTGDFQVYENTTVTNGIFIKSVTNAVGIGTTSPTARLDISDTTLAGSGSLAGSILNLAQTWNTTGTPTAFKLSVTDTASNTNSLLADFRVGGSSRFTVLKSGSIISKNVSISGFGASAMGFAMNRNADTGAILDSSYGACQITYSGSSQATGFENYAPNGSINGTFHVGASYIAFGTSWASVTPDVYLYRDSANTFAQRNGTNAQTFRLYGTFTDTSNYRRLAVSSTTAGRFTLASQGLGTGASGNELALASPVITPSASVTPSTNGDLVFEATSDTSLTIKYKGSDGTVRSTVLTLS